MERTSDNIQNAVAAKSGTIEDSDDNAGLLRKTYPAIDKLHQMDLAALKIHKVDMLVTLMTEDCIMLPPAREPLCGRDEIRNYLNDKFTEWKTYKVARCDQKFEEVNVIGDMAYEWGTSHGVYYMKNGGPAIFENTRIFRILRLQPDRTWKIARVMWHEIP